MSFEQDVMNAAGMKLAEMEKKAEDNILDKVLDSPLAVALDEAYRDKIEGTPLDISGSLADNVPSLAGYDTLNSLDSNMRNLSGMAKEHGDFDKSIDWMREANSLPTGIDNKLVDLLADNLPLAGNDVLKSIADNKDHIRKGILSRNYQRGDLGKGVEDSRAFYRQFNNIPSTGLMGTDWGQDKLDSIIGTQKISPKMESGMGDKIMAMLSGASDSVGSGLKDIGETLRGMPDKMQSGAESIRTGINSALAEQVKKGPIWPRLKDTVLQEIDRVGKGKGVLTGSMPRPQAER